MIKLLDWLCTVLSKNWRECPVKTFSIYLLKIIELCTESMTGRKKIFKNLKNILKKYVSFTIKLETICEFCECLKCQVL